MKGLKILGILICLLYSSILMAVNTELWETKEFSKCKLNSIMTDENKDASVAPEIKEVWKNPELYIWSMLEIGNTIYIGTGGNGKIYKMPGSGGYVDSGKAEVWLDTKQAGIFSLAEDKGKIYAGTSPDGIIYVIDKNGKSKVLAETKEKYIWKIIVEDNTLYVATGTEGRILKITQDGKIDTFYNTSEMNVTFLGWFGGSFYAGTGENGYVFKIDKSGKGVCIFDAGEKEIKSIIHTDTLLLVAATGDSAGTVYSVAKDNRIEKIWSISGAIRGFEILNKEMIVSAGKRLYKIKMDGSFTLVAEMPANISCMKGKFICTSEVGKLYRISDALASEGTVESDAFDTDGISEWGTIEFEADGEPLLFTRSGNIEATDLTDKAGKTWSDWSSVICLRQTGKITSPNARFIQWKAVLRGKNAKLKNVKLAYLPQNRKPELVSITVTKKSGSIMGEGKDNMRKVVWSANDPNKDSLMFDLYFKLTDEKDWSLVKKELRDSSYNVDPTAFPDGKYEFKVVCSDAPSNPKAKALKSEKISLPELVDNTAPEIKNINVSGNKLSFSAVDELSYIKSCEYAVDGGEWNTLFPQDGLFDSREENFNVEIGNAHKVVIRVSDFFDNTALKNKLIK